MPPEPTSAPRLRVTWYGNSVVGCVRKNNEDAYWAGALQDASPGGTSGAEGRTHGAGALQRPGTLLAVADGMGGAKAGEIASGMAVQILAQEMLERAAALEDGDASADSLAAMLIAAVESANERIRDEGTADPSRHGMGTTLTAVWAFDALGQIVHVGDSRAYLFRKGNLRRLTKDQSLVEKLLEDNIISPEEAQRMGAKNIILQALGSEEDLDVAHPRTELMAGDTLLLCTDGLTGVVADAELEEFLRQGGGLEEICARMIQAAEAGGGPDNITVLLGSVDPEHRSTG